MRQHSDQLPPHVLDLEHGDSGPVGGALLQRGLLRRDRTLRVLQRGQPPDPDLPRIEFATNPPCQRHISNPADPSPGFGCVNPPVGATFYPFYSTTGPATACLWQEGGAFIPGTTNNFGGSSTAEFGPLLPLFYPAKNGQPSFRYNDFRQILASNPCV